MLTVPVLHIRRNYGACETEPNFHTFPTERKKSTTSTTVQSTAVVHLVVFNVKICAESWGEDRIGMLSLVLTAAALLLLAPTTGLQHSGECRATPNTAFKCIAFTPSGLRATNVAPRGPRGASCCTRGLQSILGRIRIASGDRFRAAGLCGIAVIPKRERSSSGLLWDVKMVSSAYSCACVRWPGECAACGTTEML